MICWNFHDDLLDTVHWWPVWYYLFVGLFHNWLMRSWPNSNKMAFWSSFDIYLSCGEFIWRNINTFAFCIISENGDGTGNWKLRDCLSRIGTCLSQIVIAADDLTTQELGHRQSWYLSTSARIFQFQHQEGWWSIRSGDYAQFPPQPPGSLVMWGAEWPKFNMVIQGNYFFMNNDI